MKINQEQLIREFLRQLDDTKQHELMKTIFYQKCRIFVYYMLNWVLAKNQLLTVKKWPKISRIFYNFLQVYKELVTQIYIILEKRKNFISL